MLAVLHRAQDSLSFSMVTPTDIGLEEQKAKLHDAWLSFLLCRFCVKPRIGLVPQYFSIASLKFVAITRLLEC